MLSEALSFPRNSDDWLPTLVIGGILSMLSFLVVPVFIVNGYMVRVMQRAATSEEEAPSFTDWGGLVVDGLKLLVVYLVYGLLVFIPLGLLTVLTGVASGAGGGGRLFAGIVGVLGLLVVALLGIVVVYVVPAAAVNFAVEGRMGAAFDVSTIVSVVSTGEYVVAWVLAVAVALVGGFIGSALTFLIVGIFVLFYVQVATFYLFGRGYAQATSAA